MTRKMKQQRSSTKKDDILDIVDHLTKQRAEMLSSIIRTVVGGAIGFTLTILFTIVILAVVGTAISSEQSQRIQLLNTSLTVMGSALGAVLGYFLSRGAKHP
jgi:hypothetical protein